MRCASRFDIEVWGGYGLAVRASSTVRETVENANRHLRLLHDAAQFRLVEEGLRSRIVYEYVGTELRPGLQGAALMLVGTVDRVSSSESNDPTDSNTGQWSLHPPSVLPLRDLRRRCPAPQRTVRTSARDGVNVSGGKAPKARRSPKSDTG